MGCSSTSLSPVEPVAHKPCYAKSVANGKPAGAECVVGSVPLVLHADVAAPLGYVPSPTASGGGAKIHAAESSGRLVALESDFWVERSELDLAVKPVPSGASGGLKLVPVNVSEHEMEALYAEYHETLAPDLQRALQCTWEGLRAVLASSEDKDEALEWHWLCPAFQPAAPQRRLGLAVFRIVRGISCYGQLVHLSVAHGGWRDTMLAALSVVRKEMLRRLPVPAIRATLWYASGANGQFQVDPVLASCFKEAGWRWFQLVNRADGTRGQVLCLRRQEGVDPPQPALAFDLALGCCVLLPTGDGSVAGIEGADHSSSTDVGSGLVLAECLRRRALEQRDTGASPGTDADMVDGVVGELVERLKQRSSSAPLVAVRVAACAADCTDFAKQYVAAGVFEASAEASWKPQLGDWLQLASCAAPLPANVADAEGLPAMLCGGVSTAVNWLHARADPNDARLLRVAVRATGALPETMGGSKVAYLATQDEEIFSAVWKPPQQAMSRDALYRHCADVLSIAPPTGESPPGQQVEALLPRFEVLASRPTLFSKDASDQAGPYEVHSARLALRQRPLGALLQVAPPEAPDAEVVCFDDTASIVFCLWHTRLEELEVPLFAAIISAACWR